MSRLRTNSHTRHNRAQAATEVAIWGAIVIFLIGAIIRSAYSSQMAQNYNVKAMRLALYNSLESAKAGRTDRNVSTVLYIEDRLTPDFNKFGAIDRIPFVAQGSGTLSHLLFYPIDEVDLEKSIPLMDIYINGQYFPFSSAAYSKKTPRLPSGIVNVIYKGTPTANTPKNSNGSSFIGGWDFRCICETEKVNGIDQETCYACPLFYHIVPNGTDSFCPSDTTANTTCPNNILSEDERFDLNRNDKFNDDPQSDEAIGSKVMLRRSYISWQWHAKQGTLALVGKEIDRENGRYAVYDIDADRQEETIYRFNPCDLNITTSTAENTKTCSDIYGKFSVTLRDQFKELQKKGIITDFAVLDNQDGDFDLGRDDSNEGGAQGLLPETAMYTRIKQADGAAIEQGTFLLIKDGKAYNPENGNFVRSVNKKDQLDLVERHILLSNNTGRFCQGAIRPNCVGDARDTKGKCLVATNPVEVCVVDSDVEDPRSGCFAKENINRTCLDVTTKMLYIRSRINTVTGRKWITDATDNGSKNINLRK